MREIVKVLLQEGIDEAMINWVLDLIEEEYEVIDERNDRELLNRAKRARNDFDKVSKEYSDEFNRWDNGMYNIGSPEEKESLKKQKELRATRNKTERKYDDARKKVYDRGERRDALASKKSWEKIKAEKSVFNPADSEHRDFVRTKKGSEITPHDAIKAVRQSSVDKSSFTDDKVGSLGGLTKKVNGKQALTRHNNSVNQTERTPASRALLRYEGERLRKKK